MFTNIEIYFSTSLGFQEDPDPESGFGSEIPDFHFEDPDPN